MRALRTLTALGRRRDHPGRPVVAAGQVRVDTIAELTPTGFVMDWGPGVSGKWGLSFDRGYARMGVSSDDKVSVETVAADLQGKGWAPQSVEDTDTIDSLYAFKDGLWLDVTV